MKIAYLTSYDILFPSTWEREHTGLFTAGFYIAKALEHQDIKIEYLSKLIRKRTPITRGKWLLYQHLFKKDYYSWAEPLVLRSYAQQMTKKISNSDADAVLFIENELPIGAIKCDKPIILWWDTSLAGIIKYYPYLSNLCKETKNNIYAMEKASLDKSDLIIFVSDWAAEAAIKTYNLNPKKIRVVPWGANFNSNLSQADIQQLIQKKNRKQCKLLFLGVNWENKGGPIALEITQALNEQGIDAELTVVGCNPKIDHLYSKDFKVLGFIDKFSSEGNLQLRKLFSESHFLILPSQAETFGHVLCEANSFGVPCLASNVGGISTVIKNGINGQMFPNRNNIDSYCSYIKNIMLNYESYQQLALSSFQEYQSRLNWEVSGMNVKKILETL